MNMHTPIDMGGTDLAADQQAMKRRRIVIVSVIAILVVAIAAYFLHGRDAKGPDKAAATASQLPTVTVFVPGMTVVPDQVRVTGTISAKRDMPVGVQGEGGMVKQVLVEPGTRVRAGQVLARIDSSVQQQQVAQLQASVARAHADAVLAQAQLDRAKTLVANGFISKSDIDTRTATRDGMAAAEKLAQAQLGESRARLGRLDVRAPANGIVLSRNVEAGQIVSSASPALFHMAQNGDMEMRAQVAEQDLAKLKVGQPATVQAVGSSDQFNGKIWLLEPMIDATSRQGMARILLDRDKQVRGGAFSNAVISAGSTTKPVLPQSAIQSDDQGNYVYIVGPGDKVERRGVTIGVISSKGLAIAKGLDGTEKVVANAGAFLQPGEKIKPVIAKN